MKFARIEPLETRIAPATLGTMNLSSLNGINGFKIPGVNLGDRAGVSVSAAGDVNGDGFDDVLVGASFASPNGVYSGSTYVVFGKANGFTAAFDLSLLNGANGFAIPGETGSILSGGSVAAAGDVNGDGFDDIIIGSIGANARRGAAYVIFGKANGFTASLDLSGLNGTTGFKLVGENINDYAGRSVSGAGDVNGDGFGDVVIGAEGADTNGSSAGAAYVVFGKANGFAASTDLSTLNGTTGFKIYGDSAGIEFGGSVSGAGDVNGDGKSDVIIGAKFGGSAGNFEGAGYVIFGKSTNFASPLDLTTLNGTTGFKLIGPANGSETGKSVSSAGDVNGDGLSDLIIGAQGTQPSATGTSYVIFGKAGGFATSLPLATVDGTNGFKFSGEATNNYFGRSVSEAGDVNNDGFGDLIVGASGNSSNKGAAYLIYGKAGGFTASLDITALDPSGGFKFPGEAPNNSAGHSVSNAGDVNGDGFDDLIIGAPYSTNGAAYLVFHVAADVAGTATISKDFKSATYTDVDGDLVTVKVTKGKLAQSNFALSQPGTAIPGGFQLDKLNFANQGIFAKSNITITAKTPKNGTGDGLANIGFIDATGIDLGAVKVGGALKRIVAGDAATKTPAMASLRVDSLGAALEPDLHSVITGKLGSFTAKHDVRFAQLQVQGGANGQLGKVTIGGSLIGGAGTGTGLITTSGAMGSVKIAGSILGGNGSDTGEILSYGTLGAVFVGGHVKTENSSGSFSASIDSHVSIKSVKILGSLIGSSGDESGIILSYGALGPVFIKGDVRGGDGTSSGIIDADGKIASVTIGGSLIAGTGYDSGEIVSFGSGIGPVKITGDIIGGLHDYSGVISSHGPLASVTIGGKIDASASGVFNGTHAGLITATASIGSVCVKGNVIGGADFSGVTSGGKLGKITIGGDLDSANPTKPVLIAALGKLSATKASDALAISSVSVTGNVLNARILAGFTTTQVSTITATNPDAGIGAVAITGNWSASSIAAGVADSTADGFGRNDSLILPDNTPKLYSTLAGILIKGTATGSGDANEFFGITAQAIGKVSIHGTTEPTAPIVSLDTNFAIVRL